MAVLPTLGLFSGDDTVKAITGEMDPIPGVEQGGELTYAFRSSDPFSLLGIADPSAELSRDARWFAGDRTVTSHVPVLGDKKEGRTTSDTRAINNTAQETQNLYNEITKIIDDMLKLEGIGVKWKEHLTKIQGPLKTINLSSCDTTNATNDEQCLELEGIKTSLENIKKDVEKVEVQVKKDVIQACPGIITDRQIQAAGLKGQVQGMITQIEAKTIDKKTGRPDPTKLSQADNGKLAQLKTILAIMEAKESLNFDPKKEQEEPKTFKEAQKRLESVQEELAEVKELFERAKEIAPEEKKTGGKKGGGKGTPKFDYIKEMRKLQADGY